MGLEWALAWRGEWGLSRAQRSYSCLLPAHSQMRSDQLSRNTGLLRVDLAHLAHPVYGAPDLASALTENPAEYLPLVRGAPPVVGGS